MLKAVWSVVVLGVVGTAGLQAQTPGPPLPKGRNAVLGRVRDMETGGAIVIGRAGDCGRATSSGEPGRNVPNRQRAARQLAAAEDVEAADLVDPTFLEQ